MTEFIKAYWPWIAILLVIAAIIFGALEYRDAVASILPGVEGTGGDR
jgi:hypothetical protein